MESMPLPGAPKGLPAPRCLVHDYSHTCVECIFEVLTGQLVVIGPPDPVINYVGTDDFPFIVAGSDACEFSHGTQPSYSYAVARKLRADGMAISSRFAKQGRLLV